MHGNRSWTPCWILQKMESSDRHDSTRPKCWSVYPLEVVHKWREKIWSMQHKYLRSYSCHQPRMDLSIRMLQESRKQCTLGRSCLSISLCRYRRIRDSHTWAISEINWLRWRKDVDCSELAVVNLWDTEHRLCHIYQSNTYKSNGCPKWRNRYQSVLVQCAPDWANEENRHVLKQFQFNN